MEIFSCGFCGADWKNGVSELRTPVPGVKKLKPLKTSERGAKKKLAFVRSRLGVLRL